MQEGYRNVVEALKGEICTVQYEERYGDTPQLVCLEEDDTETKWLFFVGDLIVVEDEEGKGE